MRKIPVYILIVSLFLFASCEMEVKAFFEKYTETAAIMKMETEGNFPRGTDDAICYPSDDDHSMIFYLRNPQKFELQPRYTFNNPDITVTDSDLEFVQDAGDRSVARLTFKQAFLRTQEEQLTLDAKDISGVVSFYEPLSGRIFDSYPVKVHANTAPPAIMNPCFQRSSEGDDATYIICMYMPKVLEYGNRAGAANPIHKDTYDFYVNDQHLYIKGSDTRVYQIRDTSGASVVYDDEDTRFTTTQPTMYPLSAEAFNFGSTSVPDDYFALYFMTGVAPTTETTTYTLSLRDDDGLTNSIAISNKAKQLNPPSFSVVNNQTCTADEDTGLYTVYITHDGLCTDDTSCGGGVTFHYTVEETAGNNVFIGGTASSITGSATGTAAIRLPGGNFNITANVSKNYFIASAGSGVNGVKVRQSAIFYVDETGDDNDNGSRVTPLRTIQQAISNFKNGLAYNTYEADSVCEIRVLSDLTPPDDFSWVVNGKSFVNIDGPGFTNPVIIKGYGGTYTIDAGRSETETGRVIFIGPGCDVTLSNLKIKGGYTSSYSHSNTNDGAGICNNGNLIATDCVIENNTALNTYEGGGGIYCDTNAKLNLTRCVLRNNRVGLPESNDGDYGDYIGAAISSNGTADDSCVLNNCTITENTGNGTIAALRVFMTGGSITYNISDNNCGTPGIRFTSGMLDSVNISNNSLDESLDAEDRGYGGGIHVCAYGDSGDHTIIKNCTIKNNRARFGAGIYVFEAVNPKEVIIENCTITGNSSYTDDINSGAGFVADDDISIKGKNIIYNNYLSDGTTQNNGYINSPSHKIKVYGNISGSKIGINVPWNSTLSGAPAAGSPAAFTSNYGYGSTNDKKPGEIFISENEYGITEILNGTYAGEAGFAISSGTYFNANDFVFNIAVQDEEGNSDVGMTVGLASTFVIVPSIYRIEEDGSTQTPLTFKADGTLCVTSTGIEAADGSLVEWKAKILNGDTQLGSDIMPSIASDGTITITVPAQTYVDEYDLMITAKYLGVVHDMTKTIRCGSGD